MSEDDRVPLVLAFVSKPKLSSRIRDVAQRLGFRATFIERANQVAPSVPPAPLRQFAEHLVGPGAALLDVITRWRPALIIFDLDNSDVPWRQWVALVKSAPATRRIPVMCFGRDTDVMIRQEAEDRGADTVRKRSHFIDNLSELMQEYTRVPDLAALEETCRQSLSDLAFKGISLFNRGEYFEAHEMLEEAWNEDQSPGRELYRAILQIAVAYLQIERGNYNGAVKMFLRLRQWIGPLPDRCRGVDVAGLREDAEAVYQNLRSLGPERIAEFDHNLLMPVRYQLE